MVVDPSSKWHTAVVRNTDASQGQKDASKKGESPGAMRHVGGSMQNGGLTFHLTDTCDEHHQLRSAQTTDTFSVSCDSSQVGSCRQIQVSSDLFLSFNE